MIDFVKVIAKTPYGDTHEYAFMGDLSKEEEGQRLTQFMIDCCDDCADRFPCPDEWDPISWRDNTQAMWESMTSNINTLHDYPFIF